MLGGASLGSLHAGVAAEADQRDKLERLCRYVSRSAVAIERLSRSADGRIRYALKTPYRDGTPQVIFEPLDFLARLAALVPSPGVNLTRFHWKHPCFQPCGRPAAAQIGNPADLSRGFCAPSRLKGADRTGQARARWIWSSRAG